MTSINLGVGKCLVASYDVLSTDQFEMTQLLGWHMIRQSYNHSCFFKDLCQVEYRAKHD